MKQDTNVVEAGKQLVSAMREEAKWYRTVGYDDKARRLEAQADRWDALATSLKAARS